MIECGAMSVALPACPNCQSSNVVKNGRTRHDKQNYKCRDCGRQFVEAPQWRMIERGNQRHYRSAVVGETATGRHCPRLANFRTVGATICQSEIQAGGAGGASAPKTQKPSDGAFLMNSGHLLIAKETSSGCGS